MRESLTSEFWEGSVPDTGEECAGYRDILALGEASSPFISVYSARRGERLFILKALSEPHRNDVVYVEMLRKEYEIGVRMDHPGICRILAFEPIGKLGYAIVMEYVNGMSLRDYLQCGHLDELIFRQIVKEMLEAVEYIHKCGYYHKDLKPENILLTAAGQHVKIIDFGFSHGESYRNRIVNGGTRGYHPSDAGAGRRDELSGDIYALGRILTEMLAALRKKPGRQYALLAEAATRDRGRRFLSAGEMLVFLANREQRHRRRILACGVAFLLLTFLLVGIGLRRNVVSHSGVEPEGETGLLPDIQSIHYTCYQLIDSTITAEKSRLTAIYQQSGKLPEIHRDSMRILNTLSNRIGAEYGPNRNSLQRQQSLSWAKAEVEALCRELRAL